MQRHLLHRVRMLQRDRQFVRPGRDHDLRDVARNLELAERDLDRDLERDDCTEQDGVTPKSYRQEALIAVTIKALQELRERVDALSPMQKVMR